MESLKPSRQQRVGRYKVWLLQKRLAELSAQVEASVLEARQLISWKQGYQPFAVAELTDADKRILEHNHRIRLTEVVQKHCIGALKSITQHKWAFPFNSPVDTSRFLDYPKVVTHPMDFSTIKARQDNGYYRDPKDWWNDVMLVFSNAKRYNAPGSDCYLMAQTLQEVSEEKYDKVIAPRLAEEAAAMLRDEMLLKKKRAEMVNMQMSEAMDAQCAVLFSLMAELHAAIREAKTLASSLCEPLTLEEKQALAATIQGLPTAQLESIVAFVASRHPPSVSHSEVPPGAGGGAPSRKVQLNLGRYDPLLLRQLQHLVGTCTASRQQQQQESAGGAAAVRTPPQRVASPPIAPAARASGDRPGSASSSASPSPGPGLGPGQAVPAGTTAGAATPALLPAVASNNEPGDSSVAAPQQPQAVGVGVEPGADAAGGAQQQLQPEQQQLPAGPAVQPGSAADVVPVPPPGAAPGAGAPPPAPPSISSTQRNIADVVTNATASGISVRAGIKWPGLAVGAGVRARARALLSLYLDGPASAGEVLAACPHPQPPPQQGLGRLSGIKRKAPQASQVEVERLLPAERRRGGCAGAPAAGREAGPQPELPVEATAASRVRRAASPAAECNANGGRHGQQEADMDCTPGPPGGTADSVMDCYEQPGSRTGTGAAGPTVDAPVLDLSSVTAGDRMPAASAAAAAVTTGPKAEGPSGAGVHLSATAGVEGASLGDPAAAPKAHDQLPALVLDLGLP